jgi:pentatricopeptide repeat-containing protein PET309
LANDKTTARKFLWDLQNSNEFTPEEAEDIIADFETLISVVSGFPNEDAINTLFETFKTVSLKPSNDASIRLLQDRFLSRIRDLIRILLNSRNFELYRTYIQTIYSKFQIKASWDDLVISTLQLKYINGTLSMNERAIRSFLNKSDIDISQKRTLLSTMMKVGFLNSSDAGEKQYFIECFFKFVKQINDDHLLFVEPEYNVYQQALRLIATPNQGFLHHLKFLEDMFYKLDYSPTSFCNFMTSAMTALLPFSPNNVLNYWKFKGKFISKNNLSETEHLHYKDLSSIMLAFSSLNLFTTAISSYKAYPYLQDEEQIEILLKLCKKSKDWKMLQSQFEEMYGRGELPYVLHYSIVMTSLASMGAKTEVDGLFDQLLKRNLIPSSSIFAALISSRIYHDDIDGAKDCFEKYKHFCIDYPDLKKHSAFLYSLIFKIHFKSSDVDGAVKFLNETLEFQKSTGFNLINSELLANFIYFASQNFALAEVEHLKTLASTMKLFDFNVYRSLINAYIHLGQYEIADKLVYELHTTCDVPFSLSEVYALQFKNYRFWWRTCTNSKALSRLNIRMQYIRDIAVENKIANTKNNGSLLQEVIKYHLQREEAGDAWKVKDLAQIKETLQEKHFVPFLKHYSLIDSFKSHSNVLKIYKEMSDNRIEISSITYLYLMKSLVYLDNHNQNKNQNSLRLLQSIFEIYGLTLDANESNLKPLTSLIHANAANLCKIVSTYILSNGSNQVNIEILVHFFNQIKAILGSKIDQELRFSIYKEMSSIYLAEGKTELAESLVNSGLSDLNTIIERFNATYPFKDKETTKIPRILLGQYQDLVKLKLRCMDNNNEPTESYAKLLDKATTLNVRLTGYQYNTFSNILLKDKQSKYLQLILRPTEMFLVRGNIAELIMFKRMKYLYRLAILDIANFKNEEYINRYDLLNEFYGIKSVDSLRKEFHNVSHPFSEFKRQLKNYKYLITKNEWTAKKVMGDIPGFFLPEKRIKTLNCIIKPGQLYRAVEEYCKKDSKRGSELLKEYPNTMRYLSDYFRHNLRLKRFRHQIDQISPPERDEDFNGRRERTYLSLMYMKPERCNMHHQTPKRKSTPIA